MAARNWRLIDIDQYEDGILTLDDLVDPDPRSPQEAASQAKSKSSEVRSLLQKNDTVGALTVALSEPPYGSALEEAKNTTFATVLSVLNSTRSADIPKVLSALDAASQDNLMKYIYKGMAQIDENSHCAVLLNWHEKLTEVAGVGCIVRTMADHRTV
ncbi:actin-related protein ARPC5 [Cystobasidium minutum MCA 4210]|uniref:actin-related protein ARPC5 n=1 Tax=Cystobasidium minutum MCA 4210 TaxID=1397322 RepID=UPI0034CF1310|eukprot:jgi/Rhomi1/85429/CE85428_3786